MVAAGRSAVVLSANARFSAERGLTPADDPPDTPNIERRFWSWHVGGNQFLMGDGAAKFLSTNTDHKTFVNLSTRSGGEVIGEF